LESLFGKSVPDILHSFQVIVKRIPEHKGGNIVDKIRGGGVLNSVGFELG
jgi:hypothetical protein